MIKEDYLVKKIKQIVYILLTPLLNKDITNIKMEILVDEKVISLKDMIDNKKINEAENILFDNIDINKKEDFYLCLLFYDYLNKKDNNFLKESNFSRKEIEEGLFEICEIFGYTDFINIYKDEQVNYE